MVSFFNPRENTAFLWKRFDKVQPIQKRSPFEEVEVHLEQIQGSRKEQSTFAKLVTAITVKHG